ncbi:C-C chemokine receptor type 7-like [Erpetoichthys calabaricus]|uniref:C-C chemokine receptor type 7-like n=1 Tax=Erpetoichthys calabaricus TaxID=27687 RepID=A0A8C4XCR0_ERPCA|nr:C-C chemokine receptor type 7-like [Erpetoichthys calabaricus]
MSMGPSTEIFDGSTYITSDYSGIPEVCELPDSSFRKIFQPLVFAVVFVLGMLGNILILVIYILYRKVKSMTDVFLVNLAMADLLWLLTAPFNAMYAVNQWVLGLFICKIFRSLYSINFFSGVLFLTCISIERYIVIVQATSALKLRSATFLFSKIATAVVWVVSVILSIPVMIYSRVEKIDEENICQMIFDDSSMVVNLGMQIAQVFVGFVLPSTIMVFCYSIIMGTLLKSRTFKKHKALWVIVALIGMFFVLQMPYSIFLFLKAVGSKSMPCAEKITRMNVEYVTESLAFIRSCLNPVLYAFVGVKFRNDILLVLKDIHCISALRYQSHKSKSNKRFSFMSSGTDSSSLFQM